MGAKRTVGISNRVGVLAGTPIVLAAAALVVGASLSFAAAPDAGGAPAKPAAAAAAAPSAATAAAPVAHKLASPKLGDFESGQAVTKGGGFGWASFQFAQGTKTPAAAITVVDGGAPPSKKVLHFEGAIPDDAQMAFIGVGCGFGGTREAPQPVDISAYKGIRFKLRGDENPYRLSFLTTGVKDYNYHGKNIVAEKEWQTVDVPFSDLAQTPGWGTPLPFDPKTVTVISIGTPFQFTGKAWFEIDDVALYK